MVPGGNLRECVYQSSVPSSEMFPPAPGWSRQYDRALSRSAWWVILGVVDRWGASSFPRTRKGANGAGIGFPGAHQGDRPSGGSIGYRPNSALISPKVMGSRAIVPSNLSSDMLFESVPVGDDRSVLFIRPRGAPVFHM